MTRSPVSAQQVPTQQVSALPAFYERRDGHVLVFVMVTPKARREGALGLRAEPPALRLGVSAAPEDGKANAAVCTLLARLLDQPKRAVSLVAGQTSRAKTLRVDGDVPAIAAALEALVAGLAKSG